MTVEDERPSFAERYGRATQSSHLKVHDGAGAVMYRLRSEYDGVRASLRAAEAHMPDWDKPANELERAAILEAAKHPPCMPRVDKMLAEVDRLRKEGRSFMLTAHVMALVNLKTLALAKSALWLIAYDQLAPKGRFNISDKAASTVSGQVLDVWLDPICRSCDGRGFNGGRYRGEQQIRCRWCRSTGLRRSLLGKTAEESRFAAALHDVLLGKLNEVEYAMRVSLRQRGDGA
jgi:hypothetical protein